MLVQDDELFSLAHTSLGQARAAWQVSREWDLVGGLAGTILALHFAASSLDVVIKDDLKFLAGQLMLQHEVDAQSGGVRWRSRVGNRRPALASLAHGGSGAALALAVASDPTDLSPS